jgi:phosphate uptake regulator
MKRKVIQIADSTQLISLPRKWSQKYDVKKGEELDVQEQGNKIIVSREGQTHKPAGVEIDITGLDKDSLIFLIRGLYVRGYDEIKLIFNEPLIPHHRIGKPVKVFSVIHGEINRSTGLEIIQQKSNYCVLKNIADSSIKEFDGILRRTFLLIMDAAKDLYEGAKNSDFVLIDTLQEKHDTITKLILYNLRLLNTVGHKEYKNTRLIFHMISSLDVIVDILRNSARDIVEQKTKPSESGIKILGEIVKAIQLYYDLYYEFNIKKAEKFSAARDNIINMIKDLSKDLSKKDIRLVVSMEHCLEVFRDLYSTRIGIEY